MAKNAAVRDTRIVPPTTLGRVLEHHRDCCVIDTRYRERVFGAVFERILHQPYNHFTGPYPWFEDEVGAWLESRPRWRNDNSHAGAEEWGTLGARK